jgi:hypothetical protein
MEKADYVTVSKTSKFSRPSSRVSDSGHYMCTATSKHGSSTVAIVVKILPKNIAAHKEDARKNSPTQIPAEMTLTETEPKLCESNPCKHGTCMEEKDSTAYECACETGYIGKDCDIGK